MLTAQDVFPQFRNRRTFVGSSPRPHLHDPSSSRYRVVAPPDDGTEISFVFHFPRGTLAPRMSALELAAFVLQHIVAICAQGFLDHRPRMKAEFEAMGVLLATKPKSATDQLLPWIRSITRREEDDLIRLSLYE